MSSDPDVSAQSVNQTYEDVAIHVSNLSKNYHIYDRPEDRLKQFIFSRLYRSVGKQPVSYYRDFWALQGISFEIKKGETVGIVGKNGAGKSTLLQVLTGTLTPTSGNVQINGRLAALLELGSGFNPEFTGRENVYLNGTILGMSRNEVDARLDDILAFADIGEFIDQPVKTYSSGMYVRLAFAIQANIDPDILIVDEALAVGDAHFVHKCMLRFNELQTQGCTILFVSHDANAVRNLCERAIWIEGGEVKQVDDAGKVVDDYLAWLFGQTVVTNVAANTDNVTVSPDHNMPGLSSGLLPETSIPNVDRRLGDQKCEILGAGLYNETLNPISSTFNNCTVVIRLTIRNNSLPHDSRPIAGYIFRNAKGQEIASTNNDVEETDIGSLPVGGHTTVRMYIDLPILHPGSYAFSLVVGYILKNKEAIVADRVENSLIFDIMTNKKVYVTMRFPTKIKIER